ncbi:hypothetical protein [Caballeronia sp. S22]|uniref:hypothetical protein n=1 Tax=Caballeronia sp. S22 TaxID=3137182 RepID=UPI003530631A
MSDFRGARGSNTGDDFHELWATRKAIRLLLNEDDLAAIAVEGLSAVDEAGASKDTWDGVDCTAYFGGATAAIAKRVAIEQLKYSAASPDTPWTVARLVSGARRDRSVIARLAKAWKGLAALRSGMTSPDAVLISNQPIDPEVVSAFARSMSTSLVVPRSKPRDSATAEAKLAYAAGLSADEFQAFSASIRFEGGAGSRFALEEQVLQAIAGWTDQDIQRIVTGLRQFVRHRMRPEFAGELITRESVMLHLGISEGAALFPCPSDIAQISAPIRRAPVEDALKSMLSGTQHVCLHGAGGVGKTTALQEIEAGLPVGSVMIKYDCYGAGRYLDPSSYRHRAVDAFVQLTNQLAATLQLPLLLTRHQGSDYPRLFANRLKHAATAMAAQHPDALVVIAIDAADNAVTAAQNRIPAEEPFIHDFVLLSGLPQNVRFLVTARTGRLEQLRLPPAYVSFEIRPFSRTETGKNVVRFWPAPSAWIDDFHHLSSGVPRVQAYAFEVDEAPPSTALDRLRPAGKSLDEVFRERFNQALTKSGSRDEVARICAGLIALARPVPLSDLAAILGTSVEQLTDVCADLAPGIRTRKGDASFADEDFEHFVRNEGEKQLGNIQQTAATWLLSRAAQDRYAALNVASALVAAGRGVELLELVQREPAPAAVTDPVLRREAELQRLRLAIKVCREAGDVSGALRFVLIGAEGIKTEAALHDLLVNNPDMAAEFAQETAGRLILSDPEHIENHGPLLFQKLSVDAEQGDGISVREGWRLLNAWLKAREHDYKKGETGVHGTPWDISTSDISSSVAAALKMDGPVAALETLKSWSPHSIALEVALMLPPQLIAEGRSDNLEAFVTDALCGVVGSFFVRLPLALSGRDVDTSLLAKGLMGLSRRRLKLKEFFSSYGDETSTHTLVLDAVLTACEILTAKGAEAGTVDAILDCFLKPDFRRIDRRNAYEAAKLDFLFRAYALKEARAGREPNKSGIFVLRLEPVDEKQRRLASRAAEEHDRPLIELTDAVFEIYAAVADGLANRRAATELFANLRAATSTLNHNAWRIERQHGSVALRAYAAKSLLVLLSEGYDACSLKEVATDVHGRWPSAGGAFDSQFATRMSLRHELHEGLLDDLAGAADKTFSVRISAEEKLGALVSYARMLKPISPRDANAVFNKAVEAASELDREVMAQLKMLDRLGSRGEGMFEDPRRTASLMADVICDAAIRLDSERYFPWNESMSALARLDLPLALAKVARWDDEGIASPDDTLAPLLMEALRGQTLRAAQVAALVVMLDSVGEVMVKVLEQDREANSAGLPVLVEEAARDILVRRQHDGEAVVRLLDRRDFNGQWVEALRRQSHFRSNQVSRTPRTGDNELKAAKRPSDVKLEYVWRREVLLDSERLLSETDVLQQREREEGRYRSTGDILRHARESVSPRDRIEFLSALAKFDDASSTSDTVIVLLETIRAWETNPAVKEWCRNTLSEVVVTRLPELSYYLLRGERSLAFALRHTGLEESKIQDLVLRGIERHVDSFDPERIFELAGLVGSEMHPSGAANLAHWYTDRLARRIPIEYRDQAASISVLPANADEAVARFLFAYMGDYDVRLRWRAAHAVRRLARAGETSTLKAFGGQYPRQDEQAFRSPELAFYWLAARLWCVIAWDRITTECPAVASEVGPALLQIALDETFPHVLVRSFARDACEKLEASGHLSMSFEERSRLRGVNETPLTRSPLDDSTRRYFGQGGEERRFRFDPVDTLPYWYSPSLQMFSKVDGERFLQEAERWIIDVWGYSGDTRDLDKDRRRAKFERNNWSLMDNRHGSAPTLERLRTHLEWHAMWCAIGELLKTEPLVAYDDDDGEPWDDLAPRLRRKKLCEPPQWAADLLAPTPLIATNWQPDVRPVEKWVAAVTEAEHRAELFPTDQTSYLVVDGYVERRTEERVETVRVSSALVERATGAALLRALQTMDDAWDYKLPDEGERLEIDEAPYRLLGWLDFTERDGGIDETDPLRGHALSISAKPGRRVTDACNLVRDSSGDARWFSSTAEPPMFIYEVWGESVKDDDRYSTGFSVTGYRLLANKEQLQRFLCGIELNLICEVEIRRRGRKDRRYSGEEEAETPEGQFDRLYQLGSGGTFEVAEGRLGAWTGDSPGT